MPIEPVRRYWKNWFMVAAQPHPTDESILVQTPEMEKKDKLLVEEVRRAKAVKTCNGESLR